MMPPDYHATARPITDHRLLPHPDAALLEAAGRVADLAAGLLPLVDCLLLSVTLDLRKARPVVAAIPWDRCSTPRPELSAALANDTRSRRALRAISPSTMLLFDLLVGRWPPSAAPSRLAFMTDGTGVGFACEDPIMPAAGWLSRYLSGRSGLVVVLPFAEAGPWYQLTRATSSIPQ